MATNLRSKKPNLQLPGILVLPLLEIKVMATVQGVEAFLDVGMAATLTEDAGEEVTEEAEIEVAAPTVTLIEVIILICFIAL